MSKFSESVPEPKFTGKECSIKLVLMELLENDKESYLDLTKWFSTGKPKEYSDFTVHTALVNMGYEVGRQTVGRHRRAVRGTAGDRCRCYKEIS